ncbi:6-phospho-3-hexuloisomerase [Faecalibaculum rodentium]|uniref:6-phospho-3-hexuloisomerase n=1 Tax=Faecalibaculum rodentium TaxID=1702221 RepID=UPI0032E91B4A
MSSGLDEDQNGNWCRLGDCISQSRQVFVYGQGRSGLAMRAFANRLGHLGCNVHFIGEITCPAVQSGDLLIAGSASGSSGTVLELFRKAGIHGAETAVITTAKDNPLSEIANIAVRLPGTARDSVSGSLQPMGTGFEQRLWLSLDAFVLELMKDWNQNGQDMSSRHANLEV